MSVTIIAEDSPLTKDRMDCVYCEREKDPICPDCQGKGYFEFDIYHYELQSSNTNFYSLMGIVLGMKYIECYGELKPEELPDLCSRIMRAKNSPRVRKHGARDTISEGNITMCGLSEEDIIERLSKLEEIVVWAQSNNKRITWG